MKSDLELTSEFQRGDRAAFRKLFRRHHLGLLNFFYWLMGSHRKAEELTELVFLRVFADRDRIRIVPAFKFSVYLYHVGYTLWFGISGRHMPIAMDEVKSNNDELISAVQNLPVELRPVLVLSEMIGLPYSDTANVMDLDENDVRRRMNDAYALLRLSLPARADLNASGQASGCSLGVNPPIS